MLQQIETRADSAVGVCHASMDIANNSLLTAFDPVLSRLYKLVEALQGLLNYLVVAVGLDTGKCNDYSSPYMVSIMPEPADYFMPCINTADCRIRCLDVFNAFDEALQATVQEPAFVSRLDVNVESKYFSLDDIENQRHLPPFEIIEIAELYPAACLTVCGSLFAADRCLAVVGTEMDRNTLGIAYYCIPADMSHYVFRYADSDEPRFANVTWSKSEVIEEAFLASLHRLPSGGHDNVLVLTHDRDSDAKSIHLYTSEGIAVVLLKSAPYTLETYNYVTDMGNDALVMNSVDQVRVMPATEMNAVCDVYIMGQKVYFEMVRTLSGVHQPTQRVERVCMHKSIALSDSDFERPLRNVTEDCSEHVDSIFADSHLPVCLNEQCTDLLSVPTVVKSRDQTATFLQRSTIAERRFWELQSSVIFYAKRAGKSSLAQIIGFDASRPLYVTAKQQAVVNKKHVSSTARLTSGTRSVEDCTVTADILVTGTVSSHKSWIQSVRLRLDPAAQEFGAALHTSTLTEQSMQVQVQCTVDNCVGCQNNPWELRYVDLQSKCYAAARCGIQRCVATPVNMRKPLCNIASVMVEPMHAIRMAAHSGWHLMASTIISMVELSKPRRKKHEWQFPSGEFMQFNCMVKNTIVEAVSVFTSSLGLLVRYVGLIDDVFSEDMLRSGIMDARWYARYFMSTTALTNLITSLFLFPVYMSMSAVQAMSCPATNLVTLVRDAAAGDAQSQVVVMSQNDATQRQQANAVGGVCLSQRMSERMREMGLEGSEPTSSSAANEFVSIITRFQSIGTSSFLSAMANPVDAFVSWAIGITTTFMDWVQTIDWKHCSLPSVANRFVFQCVCGDIAHSIAPALHSHTATDGAFWCTGPLFMVDGRGEDRLVWNPYSLDELTQAEQAHASFIECISTGGSCDKLRVKLPVLERQSVNVLPVITRCRDNFKNKQWDPAVLTLGLFTREQCLQAPTSLRDKNLDVLEVTGNQKQFQRSLRNLGSLIGPLDIEERLWQCLHDAALAGNAAMESVCRRAFIRTTNDAYFTYVKTDSTVFARIDACLSYSGRDTRSTPRTTRPFPPCCGRRAAPTACWWPSATKSSSVRTLSVWRWPMRA